MNKRLLLAHPKFRRIANQIEIWIQKLQALAVQQFLKEEIQVEKSIQKFLVKEEIICDFQTILNKVGCILSMVICSEFRLGKYRDGDHREDASHFRIPLSLKHSKFLNLNCSLRKINRDQNYNLEPKFIEIIEFGAETV